LDADLSAGRDADLPAGLDADLPTGWGADLPAGVSTDKFCCLARVSVSRWHFGHASPARSPWEAAYAT